MNPNAAHSISPLVLGRSLWSHRNLILHMIRREVVGRYRGSAFGIMWSFFNPVLMLVVYTFVFSVVFKARWIGGSESKTEFALVLFSGLLVFNLFSECLNRAPTLMIANFNYVKKVIFPLEMLPVIALGSAFFHFSIGFVVWLVFYLFYFGLPGIHVLLLPVVMLPFSAMVLGFTWFLASLGVYLRDVSQVVGVATTVLMFLSPIFYPIAALPKEFQPFMQMSPLTYVIEQARDLMIWGKGLNWTMWSLQLIISIVIFWLGLIWFQKTRKGFADVL